MATHPSVLPLSSVLGAPPFIWLFLCEEHHILRISVSSQSVSGCHPSRICLQLVWILLWVMHMSNSWLFGAPFCQYSWDYIHCWGWKGGLLDVNPVTINWTLWPPFASQSTYPMLCITIDHQKKKNLKQILQKKLKHNTNSHIYWINFPIINVLCININI